MTEPQKSRNSVESSESAKANRITNVPIPDYASVTPSRTSFLSIRTDKTKAEIPNEPNSDATTSVEPEPDQVSPEMVKKTSLNSSEKSQMPAGEPVYSSPPVPTERTTFSLKPTLSEQTNRLANMKTEVPTDGSKLSLTSPGDTTVTDSSKVSMSSANAQVSNKLANARDSLKLADPFKKSSDASAAITACPASSSLSNTPSPNPSLVSAAITKRSVNLTNIPQPALFGLSTTVDPSKTSMNSTNTEVPQKRPSLSVASVKSAEVELPANPPQAELSAIPSVPPNESLTAAAPPQVKPEPDVLESPNSPPQPNHQASADNFTKSEVKLGDLIEEDEWSNRENHHTSIVSRLIPIAHNSGHSTHHPQRHHHHHKKPPHAEIATQTYRDLNDTDDDMIKPQGDGFAAAGTVVNTALVKGVGDLECNADMDLGVMSRKTLTPDDGSSNAKNLNPDNNANLNQNALNKAATDSSDKPEEGAQGQGKLSAVTGFTDGKTVGDSNSLGARNTLGKGLNDLRGSKDKNQANLLGVKSGKSGRSTAISGVTIDKNNFNPTHPNSDGSDRGRSGGNDSYWKTDGKTNRRTAVSGMVIDKNDFEPTGRTEDSEGSDGGAGGKGKPRKPGDGGGRASDDEDNDGLGNGNTKTRGTEVSGTRIDKEDFDASDSMGDLADFLDRNAVNGNGPDGRNCNRGRSRQRSGSRTCDWRWDDNRYGSERQRSRDRDGGRRDYEEFDSDKNRSQNRDAGRCDWQGGSGSRNCEYDDCRRRPDGERNESWRRRSASCEGSCREQNQEDHYQLGRSVLAPERLQCRQYMTGTSADRQRESLVQTANETQRTSSKSPSDRGCPIDQGGVVEDVEPRRFFSPSKKAAVDEVRQPCPPVRGADPNYGSESKNIRQSPTVSPNPRDPSGGVRSTEPSRKPSESVFEDGRKRTTVRSKLPIEPRSDAPEVNQRLTIRTLSLIRLYNERLENAGRDMTATSSSLREFSAATPGRRSTNQPRSSPTVHRDGQLDRQLKTPVQPARHCNSCYQYTASAPQPVTQEQGIRTGRYEKPSEVQRQSTVQTARPCNFCVGNPAPRSCNPCTKTPTGYPRGLRTGGSSSRGYPDHTETQPSQTVKRTACSPSFTREERFRGREEQVAGSGGSGAHFNLPFPQDCDCFAVLALQYGAPLECAALCKKTKRNQCGNNQLGQEEQTRRTVTGRSNLEQGEQARRSLTKRTNLEQAEQPRRTLSKRQNPITSKVLGGKPRRTIIQRAYLTEPQEEEHDSPISNPIPGTDWKQTQTSSEKLGFTSDHDMVKHDGKHRTIPQPALFGQQVVKTGQPPRSSVQKGRSRSSDKGFRERVREADGRWDERPLSEGCRRSPSEGSLEEARSNVDDEPFIRCSSPVGGFPLESRNNRSTRASFSPVANFSDLPADALRYGSATQQVPLHLQTYQRNYCYNSSQLRHLITNVLKRLEIRNQRKLKLISDIRWAKDEEKHQRKITDDLKSCYLEKADEFEKLQNRSNQLEDFCSDKRMEEFNCTMRRLQRSLAQNVARKRRLLQGASQCLDQTLTAFQKTLENIDDQWMQELTFLRGENAVLDAEYYRTQAAIRQTDTDLTCAKQNVSAIQISSRQRGTTEPTVSAEDTTPTASDLLRDARRDRALYYDQVLSLRKQCKKALKSRSTRTFKHFQQFDQQLGGIGRGLLQVLRKLGETCGMTGSGDRVLAHPVVNCFMLSCRAMKMAVIEETVQQSREEYRKLADSLKRCKFTKYRQADRALQAVADYDVEESLLPRFRQQVSDDLLDVTGCSFPS
ncbi:hypothetical protein BV898_09836 [Hypsibius exemplaris]|uniref:Uncharacterized protein n=1 Tax=Hypsibius exemplaris TaxID=2072580 RepID=A0A1W0WLH9_HYPEX|nr:hypothetical protein BV898_09836 [Hypsibius exemplaris]